ncbi:MAG: hypothetical protein MZV49_13350 [Rhodopseudomonas palustris]|nr:hypothetical protein [Rhodopseudomonas palustris]
MTRMVSIKDVGHPDFTANLGRSMNIDYSGSKRAEALLLPVYKAFSLLLCLGLIFVQLSCRNGDYSYVKTKTRSVSSRFLPIQDIRIYPSSIICGNILALIHKNGIRLWDVYKSVEIANIKSGIAPEDILDPEKIIVYKEYLWVKSIHHTPFIYRLNPNKTPIIIERIQFPITIGGDDMELLDENTIVFANPYWEKGLVRILDLQEKKYVEFGISKFVDIMNTFDVE